MWHRNCQIAALALERYHRLHGAHAPAPLTSENIMLDALLETLGTLAVLASIAAKFVYLRAAPPTPDDTATDAPPAHAAAPRCRPPAGAGRRR